MQHRRAVELLPPSIAAYAATIETADLATDVPTCPGWDLRKLTRHVGTIHRWAEALVRERATERLDPRTLDLGLPGADAGGAEYAAWIRSGGEALVTTLAAADPDTPMWAWGADQHARFWSRRMVHEALVHTADAQLALGITPELSPEAAVDGIDEFFENQPAAVAFAPGVAELRGEGESIHLHCTDADGEWMVELTGGGFRWEHAHGKGTVAVRGAAGDLLLLVYGRLPLADGRFTTFGDVALLERWLANSAI